MRNGPKAKKRRGSIESLMGKSPFGIWPILLPNAGRMSKIPPKPCSGTKRTRNASSSTNRCMNGKTSRKESCPSRKRSCKLSLLKHKKNRRKADLSCLRKMRTGPQSHRWKTPSFKSSTSSFIFLSALRHSVNRKENPFSQTSPGIPHCH